MEQIVNYLLIILKIKFKAKNSKITATPLCPGNISKDRSVKNIKRTGFNGYFLRF